MELQPHVHLHFTHPVLAWLACFASLLTGTYLFRARMRHPRLTRSESELKQAQESLRMLIDSVKDYAIFKLDVLGNIQSWNSGAQLIKGYRADEIIGRHFAIFYPAEEVAQGKPAMELKIATETGRFQEEGWRIRKDGSRFWANVVISPIREVDGTISGFSKVTRDMSEKKRADDQIRSSYEMLETRVRERTSELAQTQQKLELALEAAKMGTWVWDLKSGKVEWSGILKELLGFHRKYMPEGTEEFDRRLHPDDRETVNEAIDHALKSVGDFSAEYRVILPDGTSHWIGAKGKVMKDDSGMPSLMIGTAINIDESKRFQATLERLVRERTKELEHAQLALVHSAKMSALGEMAGGIAHEINTPLATITMKAQQLARKAEAPNSIPNSTLKVDFQLISETAKRIGSIAKGLRAFAREADHDPFANTFAQNIVEDVLTLCRLRFKNHSIDLIYSPPSQLIELECRAVQLEQVLVNLLNNAFDAVQDLSDRWVQIEISEAAGVFRHHG
jgi:PAS domain S-box-containing protein